MSVSYRARAWIPLGCAITGLLVFSASAQAEALFDSLDSPNSGVMVAPGLDATFTTGSSIFHATEIALLLSETGASLPNDDFTVSLHGGIPLAGVTFDPDLGLNVMLGTKSSSRSSTPIPMSSSLAPS